MTQLNGYAAHFNADTSGIIIERLDISDRDVCREAQRSTTGERGPIVDGMARSAAANRSGSASLNLVRTAAQNGVGRSGYWADAG